MKKFFVSLLFAVITCSCFSQDLSATDFIEDLEFLKKTLPLKHTRLFAKITQPEFERKVNGITSHADALDYETFTAELFKLTVAIGDEHTFVEPKFSKIFPIKFDFFSEGIFVTGIEKDNALALSARLVSINNHGTTELITFFKTAIQSEKQGVGLCQLEYRHDERGSARSC